MTVEEIYKEYKKLFVLIMETAGQETNNSVYIRSEEILNRHEALFKQHIEYDAPFDVLVTTCMVLLVMEIHGLDKLSELDENKTTELVDSMYSLYLKRPTKKFASRYGLPFSGDFSNRLIKVVKAYE